MEVNCPNCGTPGQLPGKFCENCGYQIPADAGQAPPAGVPGPVAQPPVSTTGPVPPPPLDPAAPVTVGAQFAVVRDGQASLNEGFTLNRPGDYLLGRLDQESGHQVDVDLRQWVQPIDVGGQKQYLVHRKHCYIDLAQDGTVSVRPCDGAEADTLVKAPGESTFTSMANLAELRPAQADGGFQLQLHDQIFMGDPDAVMYYLSGDPTAQGNYLVIELITKS